MKQQKQTVQTLFCLLLCFLAISCSRPGSVECKSCKTLPPDGVAKFQINGDGYSVEYWNVSRDSTHSYITGHTGNATSDNIERLIDWLSVPREKETRSIVVFAKKMLSSGESYDFSDVVGCQVYFKSTDGGLMHKFYYRENEKMHLVSSLTLESNCANFNNRHDLDRLYFASHNPTIFAFSIVNASVRFKKREKNRVSAALRYKILHMTKTAKATAIGGYDPKCDPPCAEIDVTRECEPNSPQPPSCDYEHEPHDDPSTAMSVKSIDYGLLSEEDADITYNLPLQYLFRDSVMWKSNFGRKYIGYYYDIYASNYVSIPIVTQSITVLNNFNTRMNWMLNPNTHGSNILIDSQFKAEATTLLNLMISSAANSTDSAHFQEAKADLNTYYGQTVTQFLTAIN